MVLGPWALSLQLSHQIMADMVEAIAMAVLIVTIEIITESAIGKMIDMHMILQKESQIISHERILILIPDWRRTLAFVRVVTLMRMRKTTRNGDLDLFPLLRFEMGGQVDSGFFFFFSFTFEEQSSKCERIALCMLPVIESSCFTYALTRAVPFLCVVAQVH
uniref:Nuclear cap-binding protein subunit 2 n=1 Tax=Rhizophora mucronata TaxID=61149 RepID=A0A2P2MTX0_RHIMU